MSCHACHARSDRSQIVDTACPLTEVLGVLLRAAANYSPWKVI